MCASLVAVFGYAGDLSSTQSSLVLRVRQTSSSIRKHAGAGANGLESLGL